MGQEQKHRFAGPFTRPVHGRKRLVPFLASCLAVGTLAATGTLIGVAAGTAGGSPGSACPGSSATKCFGLTVTPTSAAHGSAEKFTFKITDQSGNKGLGSAELFAPSGFTITGATTSAGVTPTTFPSTSALFLTLNLSPTTSATFTVYATTPCSGTSYTWGIQVKQSNNFSGTGNTYVIAKKTAGNLTGTFSAQSGGCELAFVPGHEPATTKVGSVVRSGFDSLGTPVEVELLTPTSHAVVTTFTGTVTVSLVLAATRNSSATGLSGSATVTAKAGIASFGTLTVSTPGSYELLATSPGGGTTPPATSQYSSPFTIVNENLHPCGTNRTCSTTGTMTTPTLKGKVSVLEATNAAPATGFLALGSGAGMQCTGTPLSSKFTAVIGVLNSGGTPTPQTAPTNRWTITYTITKAILKALPQTGASQWHLCYGTVTKTFKTLTGPTATRQTFTTTVTNTPVTAYVGLLPSCSGTTSAPCVLTQHKDGAGNEVITAWVAGDNYIR